MNITLQYLYSIHGSQWAIVTLLDVLALRTTSQNVGVVGGALGPTTLLIYLRMGGLGLLHQAIYYKMIAKMPGISQKARLSKPVQNKRGTTKLQTSYVCLCSFSSHFVETQIESRLKLSGRLQTQTIILYYEKFLKETSQKTPQTVLGEGITLLFVPLSPCTTFEDHLLV
eukprot:5138523-Amphidinium_carterae.1